MIYTITFFSISFIGLITVFGLKLYELEKGSSLYPRGFIRALDRWTVICAKTLIHWSVDLSREKAYRASHMVRSSLQKGTQTVATRVKKMNNPVTRFVKGERRLARNAVRSEYLENIEKHKRDMGKGEIDWKNE